MKRKTGAAAAANPHGHLQEILRRAYIDCAERGLLQSAKWSAEQLAGLANDAEKVAAALNEPLVGAVPALPIAEQPLESVVDAAAENDAYALARVYFDTKEYRRAAHVLRNCFQPRSLFLRLYALYFSGEKNKMESSNDVLGPRDNFHEKNPELEALAKELRAACTRHSQDGFLAYLYGVVLSKQNLKKLAMEMLIQSAVAAQLPHTIMRTFFMAHLSGEFQHLGQDECQSLFDALLGVFPNSRYLTAQQAVLLYNFRRFEMAEQVFDAARRQDPYTVEDMDLYSNVMFVNESSAKLSTLAHVCTRIDKYRPETCVVVGNYYSLRGEHEKAIVYFQRALKLNRNYLSALTLMGHEYIEIGSTHAALESYRRALDINPRDYRAWFGLGQAYEMLRMSFYAIYYYQRAVAMRPFDSRMWVALASVYEDVSQFDDAIRCHKRSLAIPFSKLVAMQERGNVNHSRTSISLKDARASVGDATNKKLGGMLGAGGADLSVMTADEEDVEVVETDIKTLFKIGRLYDQMGEEERASTVYRVGVDLSLAQKGELIPDAVRGALFLANHYKHRGQFKEAEALARQLLNTSGPEREEAKWMLRELQSMTTRVRA